MSQYKMNGDFTCSVNVEASLVSFTLSIHGISGALYELTAMCEIQSVASSGQALNSLHK